MKKLGGVILCLACCLGWTELGWAETGQVESFANEMAFVDAYPNLRTLFAETLHEGALKYNAETVASAVMSILAAMGVGFSLMRNGKNGWGWFAITLVVASLSFLLRFSISLFREMAVSSGPNDWDEN